MPSTATTRNRIEKQGVGENANTWGTKLNTDLDLLDDALDGVTSFSLSGSKTLSVTNYAADEARSRVIDIASGTGGTVTIPNVQKAYLVRNGSSGSVTFTTGSGTMAAVPSLTNTWIFSTGSNTVRSIDTSDLWTYKRAASDFTHASTSVADVTGLILAHSEVDADVEYEFEGTVYVKISTGSLIASWVWMAGLTDGIGDLRCNSGSSEVVAAASTSTPSIPLTVTPGSAYRPLLVRGHFIPSSGKNGHSKLSIATSSGTPTITIRAGSFFKFRRVYP